MLSGVGRSALGRRLMVDPLSLTVDACLAAVADAGLTLDDIDGLSTYPGAGGMGMSEGGVTAVEEALRLHPTWINGGGDLPGPGRLGHRRDAGGVERAVPPRPLLPHRVGVDVRGPRDGRWRRRRWRRSGVGPMAVWRAPFGALSAANWIGMIANQYLHRYGASRERRSAGSPSTGGPTRPATRRPSTATR